MIYYSLTERELNLIEKISDITCTNYEIKNNMIEVEQFLSIIEDLKYAVQYEQEKYEDLVKDIYDNYKAISKADQYE